MEEFRSSGGFEKIKEAQPAKESTTSTIVPKKEDVKALVSIAKIQEDHLSNRVSYRW
jgi:hypothetical protein